MFVRLKKNKSGVVSIQVIDKSTGKYKLTKTVGSSSDPLEIERLHKEGLQWIKDYTGQSEIDFYNETQLFESFLDGIKQINIVGTELLLGKIFEQIGFNQVLDPLFKQLILSRICFPVSKLKTTEYLKRYSSIDIDEDSLYRYMDKLHYQQKDLVQQISYTHTLQILQGNINVVFYDVTTVYFEIDNEDELRKTGFSKDGKHKNPQIVLGLLVSVDGYPLAYEIFEGNKFEGHTMLPVIEAFKEKYGIKQIVIVADSGLLSKENVQDLNEKGYEYILGARIKNEKQVIKDEILSLNLKNGESTVILMGETEKLVIGYSDARAKKDRYNREKGLKRLEKQIRTGKLTKANINNRGYNKYLKFEGKIEISIDLDKYRSDGAWDGLKGYLTNTSLSKEQIIENYGQLWKIEKAFRISKRDLKIRPIFHRLQRRIEAHICISFVAYKVYKELERLLKVKKADLSPEKAIEIAKTIYSINITTPTKQETLQRILLLNEEQKYLSKLFDF